jgi:hypothetical protein
LTGGEEEIQGKVLVNKLKSAAALKKPAAPPKPSVPQTDAKEVQGLCKEFMAAFSKVNVDANISSAAKKLT